MVLYVLKVALLATAAGSLAWVVIWLARIVVPLYFAKHHDFDGSDMTTSELAIFIDETEEAISILRYHCNELEMAITASPLVGLAATPLYKIGKYTMEACERQARVAREELIKRMREEATQEDASHA